jgi:hypothetical protein
MENEIIYIGSVIDSNINNNDTISVLGNNCCIYLYTKRQSVSKYIYQLPPAIYSSQIREEYLFDMLNKNPAIIVLPLQDGRYNSGILEEFYKSIFILIDNSYSTLYSTENYLVFKRN